MKIFLGFNDADSATNIFAVKKFIDHCKRVVCITYNAFARRVYDKFFAAENIFAGLFAVGSEIRRRTYERPFNVVALAKFGKGFCLSRSDWQI